MSLSLERAELYNRLQSIIGKTPLGEIRNIYVPHGNRIFFKEEYRNPTGSHYDRIWLRLLRSLEEEGSIEPERTPLIETTTGNSGASFAWLCRVLGYKCEVFIPGDMPSARIAQIKSFGAVVNYSPKGKYVEGLLETFRRYLRKNPGKYYCPDHSTDQVHCIAAMRDLGREIMENLDSMEVRRIDYFISALGNGSTTRGVGGFLLEECKTTIIGMEPIESPTVYQTRFPKLFSQHFSGISQSGKHGLIGTGPGVVDFHFPNMRAIIDNIENIIVVKCEDWQLRLKQLHDIEGQFVGHTSAACLHVALQLAEDVSSKTFILIFYDPYWKYLSFNGNSSFFSYLSETVRDEIPWPNIPL